MSRVGLVIADDASHAVRQLAYFDFSLAAGIVLCYLLAGGNVSASVPPTSLELN
jgi:hypothetical protein